MPSVTTELQAINTVLACIGEAPINSLTGDRTSEVSLASNTLNEVSRQVQTEGWGFNTDTCYTLAKDSSGKVPVPSNAARVVISRNRYWDIKPEVRGGFLYDTKNHTYLFSTSIVAEKIVFLLDFDDLPEAAKQYILIRSARLFQDRVVGSTELHQYTLQDEMNAKRVLYSDASETENYNLLNSGDIPQTLRRQ